MPTDVRDLLREVAPNPDGPLDLEKIMKRGKRLRWRRRTLTLCIAGALGVSAWIGVTGSLIRPSDEAQFSPAKPAPETDSPASKESDSNYTFSAVGIRHYSDPVSGDRLIGTARISFIYEWTGREFPGWHQCMFTAYDQHGRVVGQDSREFMGLRPGQEGLVDIEVSEVPDSADATCSSGRLDDPEGTYAFKNTEVRTASDRGDTTDRQLVVTFDGEWTGESELPAPANCTFSFYSSSGSLLFHEIITFTSRSHSLVGAEKRATAPPHVQEEPAGAEISCKPFDG